MLIKTLLLSATLLLGAHAVADEKDAQIAGHLSLLSVYNVKMLELIHKADLLKESIGSNASMTGSVNCAGEVKESYRGRCDELISVIKKYKEIDENSRKIKTIVSDLNKSIAFPKIALDTSAVDTAVVNKSTKDIHAMDKTTPDCKGDHMKGWKCWPTTIKTAEGNTYNILLKWNRVNMKSRGTVFYGIGGAGMGESRMDPPSREIMDQVSELDQVRTVALEMMDEGDRKDLLMAGGYFVHAGGYRSLAQIFHATVELAVEKKLFHGSFTNYFGGSNGTMLAASGFSLYNTDVYFDRAIFQMGPFLSDFAKACKKDSDSSFWLSNQAQFDAIQMHLSIWTSHDKLPPCEKGGEDRTSILVNASTPTKNHYMGTRIHVIMGAKEETSGYGKWILASNLEWFNSIEAKSKERIIRPNMAHSNSYEDMRRFMRLGPDEVAVDANMECNAGTFKSGSDNIDWSCGCGTMDGGSIQPNGCFHKLQARAVASTPAPVPTPTKVNGGVFCSNGTEVHWTCGTPAAPGVGWQPVGNSCYHLPTANKCKAQQEQAYE